MVDGLVNHISKRFLAQQAVVLTDAIENDDRVVHGITNQREQGRDDRQRNLEVQQREKPQGDEHVVKDCQNGGGSVNPLESEGNIYQHAGQSIEGNENCLGAELSTNLGTDDFDVTNREGPESVTAFHGHEDRRGHTIGFREVIEIGEHTVGILIAVVEKFPGELLVTIAGVDGKDQRILLRKERGERGGRRGIEIGLVRSRNSVGGVQRAQYFLSAGLESLLVLAFAFHEDHDFVRIGVGNIADTLDFGVAKPLRGEPTAELVDIGSLGEAHVHVGAAFKVNPVTQAAFEENRSPPGEEKNATQGKEILGFAHPVDVGLFE